MKIGKQYIGKVVSLVWCDPNTNRGALDKALRGRAALATWQEYGLIDDVTDGVVRIVHSAGRDPGAREIDEISYTVVDEALVESIVIYEPLVQPPREEAK